MWETKRLLIWGTTYPEFSSSYYETVCTGAVDDSGKLIRIYPVTLRYMKNKFSHYQWIEAEIERNTRDFRPESFRIKQDTIKPGAKIETKKKNGWAERSKWILRPGNVFPSVNALQEAQKRDRTSLGLVKPGRVTRIYARHRPEAERKEWEEQRERALAQKDLFVDVETKTHELQFVPVQYFARFFCSDQTCSTEHDMSIRDWGIYVLHRKEFQQLGAHGERKVIAKLEEILDVATKDCYLYLGNMLSHPESFMIVGIFYPPLTGKTDEGQKKAEQLGLL